VAGFHTEYSGFKFAFFYVAEYAHMVMISSLLVVLFFGGWLPPFPNVKFLHFLHLLPGFIWYLIKIMFFLYWLRLDPGHVPALPLRLARQAGLEMAHPLSLVNLLVVALLGSVL